MQEKIIQLWERVGSYGNDTAVNGVVIVLTLVITAFGILGAIYKMLKLTKNMLFPKKKLNTTGNKLVVNLNFFLVIKGADSRRFHIHEAGEETPKDTEILPSNESKVNQKDQH